MRGTAGLGLCRGTLDGFCEGGDQLLQGAQLTVWSELVPMGGRGDWKRPVCPSHVCCSLTRACWLLRLFCRPRLRNSQLSTEFKESSTLSN